MEPVLGSPQRKIQKFQQCSKQLHLDIQTSTCLDNGKLEIVITKGEIAAEQLSCIIHYCKYRRCHNEENDRVLLASVSAHHNHLTFNFYSTVSITRHIINNGFIRFRNSRTTQTKHVSMWRIYKFGGDVSLHNVWCVMTRMKAVHRPSSSVHTQSIIKHIFSFLSGSTYHVWLHVHELIHHAEHRLDLLGLLFDTTNKNIYVMPRSLSLLKKARKNASVCFEKKEGSNSIVTGSFFMKSVQMFKAVY